jgi:hypothetical protein
MLLFPPLVSADLARRSVSGASAAVCAKARWVEMPASSVMRIDWRMMYRIPWNMERGGKCRESDLAQLFQPESFSVGRRGNQRPTVAQ